MEAVHVRRCECQLLPDLLVAHVSESGVGELAAGRRHPASQRLGMDVGTPVADIAEMLELALEPAPVVVAA